MESGRLDASAKEPSPKSHESSEMEARAGDVPILAVRGISKRFFGVQALRDVSLEVYRGEVLGLVGENGAGKSTLIKIIGGIHHPDEGDIEIDGQVVESFGVQRSLASGIAIIHQELNLADNLSLAENIYLGRQPTRNRLGICDRRALMSGAERALRDVGLHLSPYAIAGDLSPGQKQLVEIAKALSQDARVLILDEPTSSLSTHEAEILFQRIEELRKRGIAMVYVSHRLGEITRLCPRVHVLRDGKNAGVLRSKEITQDNIVRAMVGRDVDHFFARDEERSQSFGPVVLRVRGLRRHDSPHRISFEVRAGEIVGIGGLVGAGRTEVLRGLFGIDPIAEGEIEIDGESRRIRSPRDAIAAGLSLAPEDRKLHGVILEMSIADNICMTIRERLARRALVNRNEETAIVRKQSDQLRIRAASAEVAARDLSGGNQQKVVLGKWLSLDGRVLLLDEPTRGVDVGAKEEIYHLIRQLAADGKAVLMVSSETEELTAICDRVLVFHEGRLSGELSRDKITGENIMMLAVGGEVK